MQAHVNVKSGITLILLQWNGWLESSNIHARAGLDEFPFKFRLIITQTIRCTASRLLLVVVVLLLFIRAVKESRVRILTWAS
jgi:hypothetical protein